MFAADALSLARATAEQYAGLPVVSAVVLAGSLAAGTADDGSDIDLYVYSTEEVPLSDRRRIAERRANRADVDNRFWEPGDEWIDGHSGIKLDVTFRNPGCIEEQLDRVLVQHQASTGYSTCFWHNVLNSQPLADGTGWYARLQQRARQPYPAPLRQAIIARNHPILRRKLSAYAHQLEHAIQRDDWVSVNHRVAALLASYFDILFALNRLPHPGEKRLVQLAEERCPLRPAALRDDVNRLLRASDKSLLPAADALVDELDIILAAEGFSIPE